MRWPVTASDLSAASLRGAVGRLNEAAGEGSSSGGATEDNTEATVNSDDAADANAQLAAALKEIEALKTHKERLEADLGKGREAKRKAKEAADAANRENGEFKALAESLEEQLKAARVELEAVPGLADKAAAWDAHFADMTKDLPDAKRAIIESISDVDTQRRALAEFAGGMDESTTTTAPTKRQDPSGSAAPTSDGVKRYTDMTAEEKRAFHSKPLTGAPRCSLRDAFGLA